MSSLEKLEQHRLDSQLSLPGLGSQVELDHIVDFDGYNDPYNPVNWSFRKKVYTSSLYSLTSVGSVWASTSFTSANSNVSAEFNVSGEVSLLSTSLLLLGWAFGPLIWAPLSEVYGRKWPVVLPFFVATVFSFGTAAAKDIQTIMITRFFTGLFGCASITCTGGVFVDLWDPSQRGNAIVGYTFAVCGIPIMAPIVSSAIIMSGASWRWTEYVTGILQAAIVLLVFFTVDESYAPVLLSQKASHLRKQTGNWALHAAADEKDTDIKDLAVRYGLRPIQILATPICFFVTVYASFIYGLSYASLASFPIIFQQTRGWNNVVGSLPFLAIVLGVLAGAVLNVHNQSYYMRAYAANDRQPVPEARLPPMMVASFVLAIGLFVMGWTSTPDVYWFATIVGTFMLGFGYYVIFTSATSYLVDTFQRWGASALAAMTFVRSLWAAGLPLAVPYMCARLGNQWAFSVLGFFAVLNIPIPFVFWVYGARIRRSGKYTSNMG